MLSAPMMMPLLGQLTRLWWRVVSVVIVSPQLGCWTAAALPAPRTTTPTTASTTASETNVARAAWRRSLVGILSSLSGRARVRVSRRTYTRPLLSAKLSIRTRGRADRRPLSSPTWRERPGRAAALRAAPRGRLLERDRVHASVILWTIRSASSVPCFPLRHWPLRHAEPLLLFAQSRSVWPPVGVSIKPIVSVADRPPRTRAQRERQRKARQQRTVRHRCRVPL